MKTNVMKRFAVLFLTLLSTSTFIYGQVATHGLDVKRLRNWAPMYLTVVCNYDNIHFENAPSTLRTFSVITAVNGNSTEFMDEDEFHRIIDQPGEVELTYTTKINGENRSFTTKLKRRKGFYIFDTNNSDWKDCYNGFRKYENYAASSQQKYYGTIMVSDEDVDFLNSTLLIMSLEMRVNDLRKKEC